MWITLSLALAYEVDAWTPRKGSLEDALPMANLTFDGLLDHAITHVPCEGSDEEVRRRLAREIFRTTARRMRLTDRRGLSRMGHGVYSGWLESESLIPRVRTGTAGVFSQVSLADGFILHAAGTAATVRFGDVLLGTDKVDHFLATGFSYYRWSRSGDDPERATRKGTRTERMFLGQVTSRAFSYADLAANWDGMEFYAGLLTPDSVVQRDEDGCPVRVRNWDWAEWTHDDWDEFLNPSVYGPRVADAILQATTEDRAAICADWTPTEHRVPLHGRTPDVLGPFGIAGFCSDLGTSPAVAGSNP